MTGKAKVKGDKAEREAATLLAELLGPGPRRKLGAGRLDDTGDIDMPGWDCTIQIAHWADALRAVREKPIAAEHQSANAGTSHSGAMIRLRGGVWRVVMTPEQFAALLIAAQRSDGRATKRRRIVKRGYELGGGKAREGELPPPSDPGPCTISARKT